MPLRPNIGIYTQPISFIGLPVVCGAGAAAEPCRSACRSSPRPGAKTWRCASRTRWKRVASCTRRAAAASGSAGYRHETDGDRYSARCRRRGRRRVRALRERRWSATTSPRCRRLFRADRAQSATASARTSTASDAIAAFRAARSPVGLTRGDCRGDGDHHLSAAISPPPRRCSIAPAHPARSAGRCRPGCGSRRAGESLPPMSA